MDDKDNANIKDNAENMMDEDNVHEDNAETMAKDDKGAREKERRRVRGRFERVIAAEGERID